jgi:hypothetical protein
MERLQGAELEARGVQRRMPKALLLGEGEATEQRLKLLHRPALLHIVGHGIVRGNEDCQAAATAPDCRLAGLDPAARVMSLSAIVLEEAYGRGGRSSQDGLLTALELQTLDLQGSEMLVLSHGRWRAFVRRRCDRDAPRRHRRREDICRAALEDRGYHSTGPHGPILQRTERWQ